MVRFKPLYQHGGFNPCLLKWNKCILYTCILLPRNQSFYRQITSQEKDGAVSGVGQW